MFHSVFLSLQEHVLKEETRRDESGSRPQQGESGGKELKWRVGEEKEARDKNQVRIWQPDAE